MRLLNRQFKTIVNDFTCSFLSYHIIPLNSATDECAAKNMINSGDTDKGNEHTSDEVLDKLEVHNDINTSTHLSILR